MRIPITALSLLAGLTTAVAAQNILDIVEPTPEGLAIDYSTCMVGMYIDADYQTQGYRAENWRFVDADGVPVPPNYFLPIAEFLYTAHWDMSDPERVYAEHSHNGARCWPSDVPLTIRD